MRSYRFSLRTIVSALVLVTVAGTAWMVHLPWHYTSMRNVHDTVEALNLQIVDRVTGEVRGNLETAVAALLALRTTLFQRVVAVDDPAKREFLFLAYLQSHPSISWVSFSWPNGDFFGAHKVSDDDVQMVESTWDAERRGAERRIDHYAAEDGDIWFERREFLPSKLYAPEQPWYQAAMSDTEGEWSGLHTLPVSGKPGISLATRLTFPDGFVGVLSVSIALERLSQFLQGLRVDHSGTVFIIDRQSRLIASRDGSAMPPVVEEGTAPRLMTLDDTSSTWVALVQAALESADLAPDRIDATVQVDVQLEDEGYFVTLAPLGYFDWLVVTIIPERDFLAGIADNTRRLLLTTGAFIIAMVVVVILISRVVVVRPLMSITRQIRRIEDFDLGDSEPLRTHIREIEIMSGAVGRMTRGLAAFQRYLPTALVRTLLSEGIEGRPQSRTATILFTDIEDFTGIGERMSPEALVQLLNEYFTVVTRPIDRHHGVITQIQGDAILAVYNVPTDDAEHAANAVRTALELQRALASRTFAGGVRVRTRVGVNTGPVVSGSVGSPERVNYTVHGDAVNVAARLEQLNKDYGTRILVSQSTVDLLPVGEFRLRRMGETPIRGKQTSITLYTVDEEPDGSNVG